MRHGRLVCVGFVTMVCCALWCSHRAIGWASGNPHRGVCYASWERGGYSHPDADLVLDRLASTGADSISLLVTVYQDTIASSAIYTTTQTPDDSDLAHAIEEAHRRALRVLLQVAVGLADDPKMWPGRIGEDFGEAEWRAWFAEYGAILQRYAELAQTHGVEQLCLGTELAASTHREADWRALIARVRTHFRGSIVYAASAGAEKSAITWWDATDYIGINMWANLTDKNDPTLAELKAAWSPHVAALGELASRWQKPIMLVSVGYRSVDGANRVPWVWWSEGAVDLQEQADAYQAAFESVYRQPWLAGLFWWCWGTDPFQGGTCDEGYTPHDKPAEDVLRTWYGGPPRSIPAPVGADYQATADIYGDGLSRGWEDRSWRAQRNLVATGQVYSGSYAISATLGAWGALFFEHSGLDASPYHFVEFHVRTASPAPPQLDLFLYSAQGDALRRRPVDDCRYIEETSSGTGTWYRVRIPLDHLDASNRRLTGVAISDRTGQRSTNLWIDDLRLVGGSTHRAYFPMVGGR